MRTKYYVYDRYGKFLKSFNTYQAAFTFKVMVNQRYDWKIVEQTTK